MKIYVARQPIYDSFGDIFGYEFLYRDSENNAFNTDIDGSMATCLLLSNLVSEFRLQDLTGGAYAFINMTEELLLGNYISLIDSRYFILEVLENIKDSTELLDRLNYLKTKGYRFALDDYTGDSDKDGLIEAADVLKVDFMQTSAKQQKAIAARYHGTRMLLAEKVETQEEVKRAVKYGYSLMQGYYFSRPVLLSKEKTEIALATYMRLWREITRPWPDFNQLADTIRLDVNLAYKFLLRMNTLQYYRGYKVKSLRQSLVRIGLTEVKRWTLAVLLQDIYGKKNNEVAKRALIRAVFTEKLSSLMGVDDLDEEAYMVGMFSTIDRTVRNNLESLLDEIKISQRAKEALFDRKGIWGEILLFIEQYESGKWNEVSEFISRNDLNDTNIATLYLQAVSYSEQMFTNCSAEISEHDERIIVEWFREK